MTRIRIKSNFNNEYIGAENNHSPIQLVYPDASNNGCPEWWLILHTLVEKVDEN